LAARYTINGDRVEYEHHYTGRQLLTGADSRTFTVLDDPAMKGYFAGWHFAAKDRDSVWFMSRKLEGADPATFKYYFGGQCQWGTDRDRIYCFYLSAKPSFKAISSGDPESFRFLEDEPEGAYMRQYALDAKHVYYYGRRVAKARPRQFENVAKDQLEEGFATSDYYWGSGSVFFAGKRVAAADPSTIRAFHLPGLGHNVYAFDQAAFFHAGQRLADPAVLIQENREIAAYVAARPELRDAYWSRMGL
jgi:hypothetical protein